MAEDKKEKIAFIQENLREMSPFLGGLDAAANCNSSNPIMAGLWWTPASTP